jgi:pSer/pThr/pTyr-binding forkhead associated (FHA) protein
MSSVSAPLKARLHLVMEGGQPGEVYDLKEQTVIGRINGDISFPHDGFMSSRHARIVQRGNSFLLVDEGSRNGTFIKIKNEVELKSGDMILIGKQLFRFEV